MRALAGSWGRVHEERRRRKESSENAFRYAVNTSKPWTFVVTTDIPKRPCQDHHRADRCWRKHVRG